MKIIKITKKDWILRDIVELTLNTDLAIGKDEIIELRLNEKDDIIEEWRVGKILAELVFVYEDGKEKFDKMNLCNYCKRGCKKENTFHCKKFEHKRCMWKNNIFQIWKEKEKYILYDDEGNIFGYSDNIEFLKNIVE